MSAAFFDAKTQQQTESAATAQSCRKEEEMKQPKITAMYERLSVDDKDKFGDRESESIENQKFMLEEYAKANGFLNPVHFTDDGLSGTRFDRPGYMKMMEEVQAGNVGILLCKDVSRLGRDHIRVGLCMETLRENGVRLISIGDGVDTINGDDDFVPFRNIMHEFYAKDCSKKIRSVFKSKGMSGKPTSSYPPYGFLKSPDDKYKWEVDPEAAEVVRRIYQLTMEGKGPYQICCILEADKVMMPAAYLATKGAGLHQHKIFENPYHWTSSTVCGILRKKEYLGHTVNFKTRKHFKDKKSHYVDESEWTVFENTHPAIIDQTTFENVQRIRSGVKRYPDGWGYVHPLTGLVFCADCGAKLYVHRINNGKDIPMYVCGNSTKAVKGEWHCTSHRISADKLMSLVAETLKQVSQFAREDKAAFKKAVQETLSETQADEAKEQKKQLAKRQRRAAEIETLYKRIYEDNILGKLPDKRFASLAADYEAEQEQLEKQIAELKAAVASFDSGRDHAARFIELVSRYENFEEMTVTMLNEFVQKIVVHERDRKGCINTNQDVEIHLNFIGEFKAPQEPIDPAVLAEREKEERERAERQEKAHQKYLKLKAEGKIAEYDRRAKEKREAGIPPRHRSKTPEEKAAQAEYRKAYKKEEGHRRWEKKKAERATAAAEQITA